MPHISIKAESIFKVFNFPITNSFLTSLLVLIITCIIAILYHIESKKKKKSLFFYLVTAVINELYKLFNSVVEDKIKVFFPLLISFFIFILLQNWFGLLPGIGSVLIKVKEHGEQTFVPLLRGGSADLNTTLAYAFISVFFIQYYGIHTLGFIHYVKKFINFSNPVTFFIGILDIISEISRVISFSFRLFGNIFAGEVLLAIISFLVPFFISFPFLIMEIFVGFVQALVFSMLTAVFLKMAISKSH
ncbi:MAG: F0F1 ATP synthase subunit A [Candidatus Roizmanbacteria bacterium]|nr:MAG: F0F1 ATP synthase subunit A [Candidatus Roizmanbacteria bacterium]